MTTMDVSHIRSILMSLTKNHVTVPIMTNEYEETCCMGMYNSIMNNECDKLDDFHAECLKHYEADAKAKKNTSMKFDTDLDTISHTKPHMKPRTKISTESQASTSKSTTPCETSGETSGEAPCETSCIRSLLECLYILRHPKSTKESFNPPKINIMQFLLEMKDFTTKTLLKDLDVSKFKVTKKKLKEDLDFIYANVDTTNKLDNYIEQVKSLIIIASRFSVYNLHIRGELTLDVLCRDANAKSAELHSKDNCFTIVA